MILLFAAFAHAATLVAGEDAATLQGTIDLAQDGDTVQVPASTVWRECLDTHGRSISIVGTDARVDAGGACDNAIRVVSGEAVSIEGLTVANAGRRAFDVEWSALTLVGVTVDGAGRADWQGGAMWTYGATVSTQGCTFTGNVGSDGGAIYHYAYSTWIDDGSTFRGNAAGGSGGAVLANWDNDLRLVGTTFEGNTAGYYGGGLGSWTYGDVALDGATFEGNTAPTTGGGALFFYPGDTTAGVLDLGGSTFTGNAAVDGGALWIGWAGTASLHDNVYRDNTATNSGGAGLVYVANVVTIARESVCRNAAQWGGGFSVQWATTDTWTNNVFVENTATQGGAAHRYAAYGGSLRQNTFAGNAATDVGGAYYTSWGYGAFGNNVVADTPSGTGIYTAEAWTNAASPVEYDGWAANAVVDASGYFFVDDGYLGNVVTADPGFVRWSRDGDCDDDDLRLLASSPFRDAGDPAYVDLDGSRSDMGAYGGAGAPAEDHDGDGFDTTVDCDDTSPDRHPGATETCNGLDDDCSGAADDGATDTSTWYTDADGDGFGDPDAAVEACTAPQGAVANADDCDDGDRWVHPGASDYPDDGIDADCDGVDNTQVVPDGDSGDSGGADSGDSGGADSGDPGGGGGCGCATGDDGGALGGVLIAGLALLARRQRQRQA